MPDKRTISVKWKMQQPVTFRLLRSACAALGMDADLAMSNPKEAMEGVTPSVGQLQAFVDAVQQPVRWWELWRKPVNLEEMPIDVAMDVGYSMVADFFLDPYRRKFAQLLRS